MLIIHLEFLSIISLTNSIILMISAVVPIIFTALLLLSNFSFNNDIPTAPTVHFSKLAGKWYEIARIDIPWGESCQCTVSNFRPTSIDQIEIMNKCYTDIPNREVYVENATLWSTGRHNNKLFYQSLWPLRHSLWVVDVDLQYRWIVLSVPNKSGLWILSRTPSMREPDLKKMLEKLILYRFPINKIVYTYQGTGCGYSAGSYSYKEH